MKPKPSHKLIVWGLIGSSFFDTRKSLIPEPHLALRGEMGAIGLSKLLPKIVKPDFVFASTSTKNSARPYDTIRPTADKLGVDVSTMYADKEIKRIVKDLRKRKFKGK